jgi:hypothetical protein
MTSTSEAAGSGVVYELYTVTQGLDFSAGIANVSIDGSISYEVATQT